MKNRCKIYSIILLIIIIVLSILLFLTNKNLTEYKDNCSNNVSNNNDNEIINNSIEHEYDCSFTKTWHIVNTLDNYISEVPEWSYVVGDMFQVHSAYAIRIPSALKVGMEVGKNYEFTYHIKGTGNINSLEDVGDYLIEEKDVNKNLKLYVTVSVRETDKLGLVQIQEPVCK